MDLTLNEIKDLAEFSGFSLDQEKMPSEDELEAIVHVIDCPKEGILNDENEAQHFNYIMFFDDCPEEGCIPLGDQKPTKPS